MAELIVICLTIIICIVVIVAGVINAIDKRSEGYVARRALTVLNDLLDKADVSKFE